MEQLGNSAQSGWDGSTVLNRILAKSADGDERDPAILLAGVLLLILVSGIACAMPARRVSKVDPMTALRCE